VGGDGARVRTVLAELAAAARAAGGER
jgi:hypothetical protein